MAIYSNDEDPNVETWENQNNEENLKDFKVVFEISTQAETPLDAAKIIQSWLDSRETKWQFYVQEDSEEMDADVFSIDLSEDDSDAVIKCVSYDPMIQ